MLQNRTLANTGEVDENEKQGADKKMSHKSPGRKLQIKLPRNPDLGPNRLFVIATTGNGWALVFGASGTGQRE
jgi:hypothetical protein